MDYPPFAPGDTDDQDRTVLIPRPAGKAPAAQPVPPAPPPSAPPPSAALAGPLPASGLNPLVRAANPLLDLVVPLRHMATHSDLDDLRRRLVQGIRTFEQEARGTGISLENLSAARYALCTLLDETVAGTPWGGGGVWSGGSLLVTFHNEAFGGEKFFAILQRLAQNPAANIDVLELMYICLALGLEGRYRVVDGGRDQLDALRVRLLQLITGQRGEPERDLSPQWQGVTDKRNPLMRLVPLWVMAAVAAVLLVVLHLGLLFNLNSASDPVFSALHAVKVALAAPAPRPPAVTPAAPPPARLAGFLQPEIQAGLVTVRDEPDKSVITLRGDGMFASGSADVTTGLLPLLARIGDALKTVPGRILVAGHSDNQAIRSVRFPSNWHLSQARAESVARLLAARLEGADRIRAEGRADSEPVAPNDTPANRSRNRRVEVTVFAAGQ